MDNLRKENFSLRERIFWLQQKATGAGEGEEEAASAGTQTVQRAAVRCERCAQLDAQIKHKQQLVQHATYSYTHIRICIGTYAHLYSAHTAYSPSPTYSSVQLDMQWRMITFKIYLSSNNYSIDTLLLDYYI